MNLESAARPRWLSSAGSSAMREIFDNNSSSVGASAAAGMSSQWPLHPFASSSQDAETVKMTGLLMNVPNPEYAAAQWQRLSPLPSRRKVSPHPFTANGAASFFTADDAATAPRLANASWLASI